MATTPVLPPWVRIVEHVDRLAEHSNALWQCRCRLIDTRHLMLAVLKLVAERSHASYGAALSELTEEAGLVRVAKSSFCAARRKLPADVFRTLHEQIVADAHTDWPKHCKLWHGRRVLAVDGTKLTLLRELAADGFRVPPNGYYPLGLLSCLYCIESKIPLECLVDHREDERRCAHQHLKIVEPGDVVVYDRGYFSYALLKEHVASGKDAVFRLSGRGNFREIEGFFASPARERVVTVVPRSTRSRDRCREEHGIRAFVPVRIRLVKYRVNGKTYCLGTTLLAKRRFPAKELVALYASRWGVEELFKTSKRTLAIEAFHSRCESGVRQEIYANVALIALARLMAHQAEVRFCATSGFQANFRRALHETLRNLARLLHPSKKWLAALVERLVTEVGRHRERRRPGRRFPRKSRQPHRRWMPQHHVSQAA